jgi:dolichyl-phosphate beta-glucosyltransferase
VVVPAYNEGGKIGPCLSRVGSFFRRSGVPFEVLVVDDGSSDSTLAEARCALRGAANSRIIAYRPNRGKGYAVRRGVLLARGERILFLDADLSTDPSEWPKLARRLEGGADLAIGSRKMAGARLLQRQPWWREKMGKVFTALVRFLLVDVSDATCGFKAMTRRAARALFSVQRLDDWSFDAEVLFLARRAGMLIAEVPVRWRDNPRSKVRPVRDALRSLAGIASIRLFFMAGLYRNIFSWRRTGGRA